MSKDSIEVATSDIFWCITDSASLPRSAKKYIEDDERIFLSTSTVIAPKDFTLRVKFPSPHKEAIDEKMAAGETGVTLGQLLASINQIMKQQVSPQFLTVDRDDGRFARRKKDYSLRSLFAKTTCLRGLKAQDGAYVAILE